MTDIGKKINLANNVGLSLIYTENDLVRELESWGYPELATDRDFLKYLHGTVVQCEHCGTWQHPDKVSEYECDNCSDQWEEDE